MKILSTVRVSVKGLTANKLRTFFMMVGVLIGITALTIIVSVGQGAKVQVMQKMENLSAFGAVMVIPGGGMTRGLGSVDAVPATLATHPTLHSGATAPTSAAHPHLSHGGRSQRRAEQGNLDKTLDDQCGS
ncbi:MAG: hypothetical protein H6Q87_1376, partial [candidate division NC10 bacterium]|nr:hypothetical protein [candidate division NC10 bacterium]